MPPEPGRDLSDCGGIVTGASRGLGRAIALELGRAGAKVALWARSAEDLRQVAAEIVAAGGAAATYALDVTDEDAVERAADEVAASEGGLRFLVNNAGALLERPFLEISRPQWRDLFAVNVEAAFLCARAAATRMDPAVGGSILNVSSVFARKGVPGFSAYAASKAALLGLTSSLAVELAPRKIRVNAILPGHFATDMTSAALSDPDLAGRVLRSIPAHKVGEPDEMGAAVRFLLSDAASFTTGASIVIDGGFSVR